MEKVKYRDFQNNIMKLSKTAYQEFEAKLPPLYRVAEMNDDERSPALIFYSPFGDKLLITYE